MLPCRPREFNGGESVLAKRNPVSFSTPMLGSRASRMPLGCATCGMPWRRVAVYIATTAMAADERSSGIAPAAHHALKISLLHLLHGVVAGARGQAM